VPTWWDETRVLAGKIGEVLVTARRKGATWYVGGISAGPPRVIEVPLSFLGKDHYATRIWKDAPDSEQEPNHLVTTKIDYGHSDLLPIHFSRDGGFVAQLIPTR
jgi:alpha-glucosidase